MPSKFVSLTSLLLFGNLISTNGENAKCSTITTCGDIGKIAGAQSEGILPAADLTDVYCAGTTCTTADEATCCQQEWSPGVPNDSFFTDMLGTYTSDFCIATLMTSLATTANQKDYFQGANGAEWCKGTDRDAEYDTKEISADADTYDKKIQECAELCVSYDGSTTAKKVVEISACVAFMIKIENYGTSPKSYCYIYSHTKDNIIDGSNHYSYPFYGGYYASWRSKCYIKKTFVPAADDDDTDYADYCNYIPPVKCTTYDPNECENGLGLIGNAANVNCAGGACTKPDDQNTCCKGDATCLEDEHVVLDPVSLENVCTSCAAGKTKPAGDSTSNGLTDCTAILCASDGSEQVVNNACVACVDATKKAAPSGDASGANTECYGKDDLTAIHVAKLINLVGSSTIDVATEQTCLKARYNAIAGCSSSTARL